MNYSTNKVRKVSYFVELWQSNFPDYTNSPTFPRLWAFSLTSAKLPDFFQVSRNSRTVVTLEWPKKILPSSVETLCRNNEDIPLHICDNFSHRSRKTRWTFTKESAKKNKPGSSWTTRKVLATVLICMREYVNWLRFTCMNMHIARADTFRRAH